MAQIFAGDDEIEPRHERRADRIVNAVNDFTE